MISSFLQAAISGSSRRPIRNNLRESKIFTNALSGLMIKKNPHSLPTARQAQSTFGRGSEQLKGEGDQIREG
jgi:hypothetical protein